MTTPPTTDLLWLPRQAPQHGDGTHLDPADDRIASRDARATACGQWETTPVHPLPHPCRPARRHSAFLLTTLFPVGWLA